MKGAVDTVDQMCSVISISCNLWPLSAYLIFVVNISQPRLQWDPKWYITHRNGRQTNEIKISN